MTLAQVIVGLVVALRIGELVHARRNTRRLLAQGGIEAGAGHYPWLVGLHAAWLAALAVMVSVRAEVLVHAVPLGLFVLLLLARWWVIASLGPYWTTRIITVPGAPLVTIGPYRFLRHPNYVVVALEVAVLPLVFGAWKIAVAFTIANGILLVHRIRVENSALAARRGTDTLRQLPGSTG